MSIPTYWTFVRPILQTLQGCQAQITGYIPWGATVADLTRSPP